MVPETAGWITLIGRGMFSAETIDSYSKILDQPFSGEEYQDRWNELKGIDPIA